MFPASVLLVGLFPQGRAITAVDRFPAVFGQPLQPATVGAGALRAQLAEPLLFEQEEGSSNSGGYHAQEATTEEGPGGRPEPDRPADATTSGSISSTAARSFGSSVALFGNAVVGGPMSPISLPPLRAQTLPPMRAVQTLRERRASTMPSSTSVERTPVAPAFPAGTPLQDVAFSVSPRLGASAATFPEPETPADPAVVGAPLPTVCEESAHLVSDYNMTRSVVCILKSSSHVCQICSRHLFSFLE